MNDQTKRLIEEFYDNDEAEIQILNYYRYKTINPTHIHMNDNSYCEAIDTYKEAIQRTLMQCGLISADLKIELNRLIESCLDLGFHMAECRNVLEDLYESKK